MIGCSLNVDNLTVMNWHEWLQFKNWPVTMLFLLWLSPHPPPTPPLQFKNWPCFFCCGGSPPPPPPTVPNWAKLVQHESAFNQTSMWNCVMECLGFKSMAPAACTCSVINASSYFSCYLSLSVNVHHYVLSISRNLVRILFWDYPLRLTAH